jgi:hypothetical protein
MDFIEHLFGVSPDGDSGAFEFALFAVPIVALAMWAIVRKRQKTN